MKLLRAAFTASALFIFALLANQAHSETLTITESKIYRDTKLGITFITGKVNIPEGVNAVTTQRNAGQLRQIVCSPLHPDLIYQNAYPKPKRAHEEENDDQPQTKTPPAPPSDTYAYFISALVIESKTPASQSIDLEAQIFPAETKLQLHWDWSKATTDTDEKFHNWTRQREGQWNSMLIYGPNRLLKTMAKASNHAYASTPDHPDNYYDREDDDDISPSLLALIGGRAAIDETLQMRRLIKEKTNETTKNKQVPLASIAGVEVKSHPYADMLATAGKTPPEIPLANYVPTDRALFYIAKPAAIRALLSDTSPSMRRMAALANSGMNLEIFERYTTALGIPADLAEKLWSKDLAKEIALSTPDLYFADGTDVTMIIHTKTAGTYETIIKPLLKFLGNVTEKNGILTVPAGNDGAQAYWSSRGEYLFLSTNETELRNTLALHTAKGKGSLGQSDEFRYMQLKLPLTDATEGYIYLSDPFIRQLVGPKNKIAQYRRTEARLRMENILAGALLRRLDAPTSRDTLPELQKLGYIETDNTANTDITYTPEDLNLRSKTYGPLARMNPLSAQNAMLTTVNANEAEIYATYRESYTTLWSQYFDPIALRLNAGEKADTHELETFILPLVENTLYNGAREWIASGNKTIKKPIFDREPITMLSATLTENAWSKFALNDNTLRNSGIYLDDRFFDLLGPTLHIALIDSDPRIRMGNGGTADTFATDRFFGRDMLLMAPLAVNMLTRPCELAIEVSDPKTAQQYLDNAAIYLSDTYGRNSRANWVQADWSKRGDNEWILSLTLIGTATLDYAFRIENNYLIISNFPWAKPLRITGSRTETINGLSLEFWPRAMKESLPSDFATAMKAEREKTNAGLNALYPWMLALDQDADQATATALRTTGAAPILPAGKISWRYNTPWHERFGSLWKAILPEYKPDAGDFGTFDSVQHASVNMQFEDDGLRTRLSWETTPAK